MIKAIFMDFDGTISDAHRIAHDSMKKTLDEYGLKYDEKIIDKALGNKMKIMLKILGVKVKNLQQFRKRFYKHFTYSALHGGIAPCVDLEPLVQISTKYPIIVISNSETSFIKASIKKLHLHGVFDAVYGADKFTVKDKLLKKLFKKMQIRPGEAIYIGDRFSDVSYGHKARCISIAIHNKCAWSTLKEIKAQNPDYIIKDFKQLQKLLKKL